MRDVIQKTQLVENSREKTQELASTQKTYIKTMNVKFSRESTGNRDDYDDAIEGYMNRISKAVKSDLPKVNINERRDVFEMQKDEQQKNSSNSSTTVITESISINIKDRISAFNQNLQNSTVKSPPKEVDIPTSTKLKDRLMSLNQVLSPEAEESDNCRLSSQFNMMELKSNVDEKPNDELSTPTNEKSISQLYESELSRQQNVSDSKVVESNKSEDDGESADMESSVSLSEGTRHISFLPLKLDNAMASFANNLKKPNGIFNFIQSNLMDGN